MGLRALLWQHAKLCLVKEDAREAMMEKAEAKVPREAKQTAVNKIPAQNFQSTEVEAEYAKKPEDTPDDEPPDDGGGALVPNQHVENGQRIQLDSFRVQDHPPDGGGVRDGQGGGDCCHDLHAETRDDGGVVVIVPTQQDDIVPRTQLVGFSVQDHPPDVVVYKMYKVGVTVAVSNRM